MKNLLTLSLVLMAFPVLAADEKTPAPSAPLLRGARVPAVPTVTLAALLAAPEKQEGKDVVVEGQVRKACERKGCWMELAPDAQAAGVRVTFKNYAFFVPTDAAGSTARVVGKVHVTEVSERDARHYRSEGATVPTGADGKAREVQIVATGVELRRSAVRAGTVVIPGGEG